MSLVDDYTKALSIIDMVAKGRHTLTRACDEWGITTTRFHKIVKTVPELIAAFEEAEQRGADSLADRTIDEAELPADPKMAAVVSKNIQWLLSRRFAKKFGDRMTVDVNISASEAVVRALARAKDRAQTIEGVKQLPVQIPYSVVDAVVVEDDK